MAGYPSLNHIGVGAVIGAAGGDPWLVDESMQAGDPAEISDLSRAFVSAAACTAETYREFSEAQQRFRASWDRHDGEHPINDSAEVRRATAGLLIQQDQLPSIGAHLATIAAELAEAQRFSGAQLANLNTQLRYLDALISAALAEDNETAAIESAAITVTAGVLHQVEALRDAYCATLDASVTELRSEHGYDPAAIEDSDGDGTAGSQQRGRDAVGFYDANERAKDETLVSADGPLTDARSDAEARLRDFAAATDPATDPEARRLAAERLDDFRMAAFAGPLPTDPILGGDARTRARARLDLQRRLERGSYGLTAASPDRATEMLDAGEQFARAGIIRQAIDALIRQGLSRTGAVSMLDNLAKGTLLTDLADQFSTYTGAISASAEGYSKSVSTGRHALGGLSPSDVESISKLGKRLGAAGTAVDIVTRAKAIEDGAPPYETIGGGVGSIAGGAFGTVAGWAFAGSFIGPEGAAIGALVGAVLASEWGESFGEDVGSQFDK